ncbi:type IX secretion system membrane protein PorP/SprF [Pontibacter sp. HSC-14F20]|uniref:PorP/SprF family type IX secretion system membrane protein n=1 Tax=Pontibacter sp. HSC-14F20 TaxID=2864136 RepID=UPI001C735C5F|nr:type IX secretion system membrane protein PorP/SprF [Pontibacter sp. HSC-14F20]MBX0334932.1 type IX secretion system membrane protein PorP/SprF [Pontibacter sp. HSC-14F20]
MRILYILLALLFTFAANAQQNPQYSQYIFNSMAINPAYTGTKGVLNINAFHRAQWTGIDGAPTTQALSVDGLTSHERLGLGLNFTRDKIGAYSTTSAYANAAARVSVSARGTLSLGIAAGVVQSVIDGSELGIQDDPSIPAGKDVFYRPDVKLGVYFNTPRFYAGISASDLIQYKDVFQIEPIRHYYFTTGYVFDVSSFVKLKPSILVKEDFHAPANVDLNGFVLLGDRLWLGSSYRTSMNLFNKNVEADPVTKRTAVALIAELQVTNALRLGYSYDRMLNDLSGFQSHEISVGYYFFKKQDTKMLTPQYF